MFRPDRIEIGLQLSNFSPSPPPLSFPLVREHSLRLLFPSIDLNPKAKKAPSPPSLFERKEAEAEDGRSWRAMPPPPDLQPRAPAPCPSYLSQSVGGSRMGRWDFRGTVSAEKMFFPGCLRSSRDRGSTAASLSCLLCVSSSRSWPSSSSWLSFGRGRSVRFERARPRLAVGEIDRSQPALHFSLSLSLFYFLCCEGQKMAFLLVPSLSLFLCFYLVAVCVTHFRCCSISSSDCSLFPSFLRFCCCLACCCGAPTHRLAARACVRACVLPPSLLFSLASCYTDGRTGLELLMLLLLLQPAQPPLPFSCMLYIHI